MRSGTGVDAYQKKTSDMINPSKKLNPFTTILPNAFSERARIHSLGRSVSRSLGRKLLFVFPLTNAQLHLTKRKMSSNGSANVKRTEAMSDEIVTAMSTACGASIFVFELFKKNLESICCPSYEMIARSWQAWSFSS